MAEVLKFGLGVAGLIDLLGAIEDGDKIAFLDTGPVGDELSKCHRAALAPDLRHEDFGGMERLESAGEPDFALATGCVRGGIGGMMDGWRGAGTGRQKPG